MRVLLKRNGDMHRELAVHNPGCDRGAHIESSARGTRRHRDGLADETVQKHVSIRTRIT